MLPLEMAEGAAALRRAERRRGLGLPEKVGAAEPEDLESDPEKYGYVGGKSPLERAEERRAAASARAAEVEASRYGPFRTPPPTPELAAESEKVRALNAELDDLQITDPQFRTRYLVEHGVDVPVGEMLTATGATAVRAFGETLSWPFVKAEEGAKALERKAQEVLAEPQPDWERIGVAPDEGPPETRFPVPPIGTAAEVLNKAAALPFTAAQAGGQHIRESLGPSYFDPTTSGGRTRENVLQAAEILLPIAALKGAGKAPKLARGVAAEARRGVAPSGGEPSFASPIDVLRGRRAPAPKAPPTVAPELTTAERGTPERQAAYARAYEAAEQARLNEAARAIRPEDEIRLATEPKVRPPGAEVEIATEALREARAREIGRRIEASKEAVPGLADHELRRLGQRDVLGLRADPEGIRTAADAEIMRRASSRMERVQEEQLPRSPAGVEQLIETREEPKPGWIASTVDSPKPPPTPSPVSPPRSPVEPPRPAPEAPARDKRGRFQKSAPAAPKLPVAAPSVEIPGRGFDPVRMLRGESGAAPPPGVGMAFFPGSPGARATATVLEGTRALVGKVKQAFERPEPYASALPPDVKTPLDLLRGAREPKRILEKIAEPLKRTVANVRDFADAWNTLGREPSIGLTGIDLQSDFKALVHLVDDVGRQKNKVVAAFDSTLKDPRDVELASTALALRDLAQTVKENAELPARKAEAQFTVELLGEEPRLTPQQRVTLEEARVILGYEERGLPAGLTPERVEAHLREAEAALADRPGVQESVSAFEQTMREAGKVMREVYGIDPREHYFPHFVIHEEAGGIRIPGLSPKARVPFSGAAQARVGSSKPFLVDAREVLSRHLSEVLRAKAIHEFVKKLQASPNNVLPRVLETGEIPKGYALWSPHASAPTLYGLRASLLPVLRKIRGAVEEGIVSVMAETGNPAAVRETLHLFQGGSMKPYMVLKEGVIKALDSFQNRGPEATAGAALRKAAMTLFKATVLVPSSGVAYLRRNAITDLMNGTIQAADVSVGGVMGRLGRGAANLAKLPAARVREVLTGKESPTLEYARERGALQAGYFGSAGAQRPAGSFVRSMLGQTAPRPPFRLLTPGGKALRAIEDVALFAPRLAGELIRLLEAGPRTEMIRYLEKQKGYKKLGAAVKGNQAVVDYRVLSQEAQRWREVIAPFIAWYMGTEVNFATAPVRGGSFPKRMGSVMAKAAPFIAAYLTWNYWLMQDVEEALDHDARARAHLNLGFTVNEEGRQVPVTADLGVDLPATWKLGTAAGLWAASEMAQDPKRKRELGRLSDAFGRNVRESAKGLLGPIPGGAYTLASGKTLYGDRPVESERTATLSDEERLDEAERRYGVRAEPRVAAAAAPFVSPLRTLQRFEDEDPVKAERARAKFAGDPRQYHEPGRKATTLRRNYLTETLRAYADALEADDRPAAEDALEQLVEMRAAEEEIDRFLATRERERAWRARSPEERRESFNERYAPAPQPSARAPAGSAKVF